MKNILITCVFLFAFSGFAQNKPLLEELTKLGRDSLIKLAVKKINDPKFIPANYDRVIVKADSENLIVCFDLSVVFKGSGMCYYDAITVSIFGNYGGNSVQGNCDEPKYYNPSKKVLSKIKFVFDVINKENEVGDIPGNKLDPGESMTISEHATYYYVEMSNYSTYSHYKINKITGAISDAGHKHYAHNSFETDNKWQIIK